MAFVIVSRRNLTSSHTRTVGLDTFLGLSMLVLLLVLGLGWFLGNWLARPVSQALAATASPTLSESSESAATHAALVERISELSARMVQLKLETSSLVERINAVKEFEQHMQMDQEVPLGPLAKTQPGSGGPLLDPLNSPGPLEAAARANPAESTKPAAQMPQRALAHIARHLQQVSELLAGLHRRTSEISLAHMSFPGRAPVQQARITSRFGNRSDPFRKRPAFHSGIDFAAPIGTPIQASAGGKVIFSGMLGAYGNAVEIDHGAGLVTRYAHLSRLLVKKNQVVTPGQLIAKMGTTGRSTGSHLHFEVLKNGHFVDPAIYLKKF